MDSGYNSPPASHGPAPASGGYSAPASGGYSAPAAPVSGYSSSTTPVQSGYTAPTSGGYSAPTDTSHSGYSAPATKVNSGYSSLHHGYSDVSTPIPIFPVPTYLPIQYNLVQIPPGYQVGNTL